MTSTVPELIVAVVVGMLFPWVFLASRNAWLRRKHPAAALAWLNLRRVFGASTNDVVAEMALEISTHVVFERLAVELAKRSGAVFEEVARGGQAALLALRDSSERESGSLKELVDGFSKRAGLAETHMCAQAVKFEEATASLLADFGKEAAAVLESIRLTGEEASRQSVVDSTARETALLQQIAERCNKMADDATAVARDASQAQLDEVCELIRRSAEEAFRNAAESSTAKHDALLQQTSARWEEVHAAALLDAKARIFDAAHAIHLVGVEAVQNTAATATARHAELIQHLHASMVEHANRAIENHDSKINSRAVALFHALNVKVEKMEKDMTTKHEVLLDQLHKRIKERTKVPWQFHADATQSPFGPAPVTPLEPQHQTPEQPSEPVSGS